MDDPAPPPAAPTSALTFDTPPAVRAPPANRLEQLKGDRAGQWSLRVNDQFRICFRWTGSDAEDVEIMDYH